MHTPATRLLICLGLGLFAALAVGCNKETPVANTDWENHMAPGGFETEWFWIDDEDSEVRWTLTQNKDACFEAGVTGVSADIDRDKEGEVYIVTESWSIDRPEGALSRDEVFRISPDRVEIGDRSFSRSDGAALTFIFGGAECTLQSVSQANIETPIPVPE